jgi:hypothetical protein
MSRLRMAAAAALVLVLTGCGTAAGPGSGGSSSMGTIGSPTQRSLSAPSPSSSPVTPAGNVLTAADTGARVTLMTGQRLTVDLAPGAGAYAWHRPRLTGSGLRLLSVTGGYPSHGLMRAVYLASGPGTAVLSSSSDMPCLHARPRCLVAQRLWTATVIIQAKPL